jgi:hypothetical protein
MPGGTWILSEPRNNARQIGQVQGGEALSVSRRVSDNDRVIFIPHQELFLVPFAALQDESGKYLIEKHTILTVLRAKPTSFMGGM